jgi:DNA helicase-2/ATP-dependent DNA helicase PcrA
MKRRVYGEELASEPSQFLNEMPLELIEDLSRGNSWLSYARSASDRGSSPTVMEGSDDRSPHRKEKAKYTGKTYDSVDSIAEFFKQRATQLGNTSGTFQRQVQSPKSRAQGTKPERPGSSSSPSSPVAGPPSSSDFVPGSYVKHAKYGRGLVLRREGVGDSLKLTVTFPGYGQKKLIEKYAGLERA